MNVTAGIGSDSNAGTLHIALDTISSVMICPPLLIEATNDVSSFFPGVFALRMPLSVDLGDATVEWLLAKSKSFVLVLLI